jgi:hypothetical protein
MIKKNRRDAGIPNSTTKVISNIYHKAKAGTFAGKSKSQAIRTNKGVDQGCPLSLIPFDLAIDPLLKVIEILHREYGHSLLIGSENIVTSIQAYTDDILLFRESKEGADNILKQFSYSTNMQISNSISRNVKLYKCVRNE